MILELAQINLQPGTEAQFEAVFPTAIRQLMDSPGYVAHQLHRSIENPSRYALMVHWHRLEDHTEKFRGSPAFAEWRRQLAPFLAAAPLVEHFSPRT